jgi:hypothetical protein
MTYQQIHEILNDLRRVHEEAAACCAAVDDASDERLRLLAGLFRDGEAQLAMRLKQTQEGVPVEESTRAAASLERWVQFVPTGGVDKALRKPSRRNRRGIRSNVRRLHGASRADGQSVAASGGNRAGGGSP